MRSIEFVTILANRQTATWSWWFDAACGGGVAGAVLSHVIDALCFMLDACARVLLSKMKFTQRSCQSAIGDALPWIAALIMLDWVGTFVWIRRQMM